MLFYLPPVKLCNFWSHHTGIAALFNFNVLPQVVNVKQCIVNEAAVTVSRSKIFSLLFPIYPAFSVYCD